MKVTEGFAAVLSEHKRIVDFFDGESLVSNNYEAKEQRLPKISPLHPG
jgi:hypothetical protein